MRKVLKILFSCIFFLNFFASKIFCSSLAEPLNDVVTELFVKREVSFEFVIYGNSTNNFSNSVDLMLKLFDGNRSTKILKSEKVLGLKNSAVIFVDQNFLAKNKDELVGFENAQPQDMNFVIITDKNFDLSLLAKNPTSHFGHFSHFSYFLTEIGSQIELRTFEWWTEKVCNQPQLITLNSFDLITKKWQKPLEIPQKFLNFHGCPLKSSSSILRLTLIEIIKEMGVNDLHPALPLVFKYKDKYEVLMQKAISQNGNFEVIEQPEDEGYANFKPEDNHTTFEHSFFMRSQTFGDFSGMHCKSVFFQIMITAMYSPPMPYTNYEKMILPFDAPTWFFLCLTFGLAFLSIFLMNLLPSSWRDIVYGKNVNMPSFNVIGTFFGIGQTKLPDNNFGRIILMSFIFFCLIFRTAYQGKLKDNS